MIDELLFKAEEHTLFLRDIENISFDEWLIIAERLDILAIDTLTNFELNTKLKNSFDDYFNYLYSFDLSDIYSNAKAYLACFYFWEQCNDKI